MSRFATTATRFLTDATDSPDWEAMGRVKRAADALRERTEFQTGIRKAIADKNYENNQELMKFASEQKASLEPLQNQVGMANMFGSVASQLVGGIGGMMNKAPTPGIGTGAEFGEIGTPGSDMAAFGYTPEQDRLFNSGLGVEWSYSPGL